MITDFDLERLQEILGGGLMARGENVTQTFRSGLQVESRPQSTRDQRAD